MRHGSLFSGIGGFDLASEWMGWKNVFHCEWNEFGKKVLHHYWPNAESFDDITKTDFTKYANKIDILTGGFPCQPYSSAGQRKGKDDERHLWPEMLRAIREIAPRFVVGENVRGLTNWNGGLVFDEVCAELENLGYQIAPVVIPACAVNAPHRRERIWFVASNTMSVRLQQCENGRKMERGQKEICGQRNKSTNGVETNGQVFNVANTHDGRLERGEIETHNKQSINGNTWDIFPTQSPICSGDDGLPTELDGITFSKWRNESIKAYGNAIVPQVAYEIFKAIEATIQGVD
jgi:DNA (cytosine-5)-methyltransferase 1